MADVAGLSSASPQVDRSLDAFNFCLADVRDGLGPYLAVYLLTVRHWNEAEIGLIMTIAGLAALLAQTPAGALIYATRAKRAIMVIAALVVTTGSLLLPFLSSFWPVTVSQAVVHATGSVFAPAIAAITLGIVGHVHFARRTGRNEAFNHAGNAFAAAAAGGRPMCGGRSSCSFSWPPWPSPA
jgi:MFS family permease